MKFEVVWLYEFTMLDLPPQRCAPRIDALVAAGCARSRIAALLGQENGLQLSPVCVTQQHAERVALLYQRFVSNRDDVLRVLRKRSCWEGPRARQRKAA